MVPILFIFFNTANIFIVVHSVKYSKLLYLFYSLTNLHMQVRYIYHWQTNIALYFSTLNVENGRLEIDLFTISSGVRQFDGTGFV